MRPLIIDSFAGGGAISRLLPPHVPGLLGDALLLGATGLLRSLLVGVQDAEPLHQIGLADSRRRSFNEGLSIGRVVLRSRHEGALVSQLRVRCRSPFREAGHSGKPSISQVAT